MLYIEWVWNATNFFAGQFFNRNDVIIDRLAGNFDGHFNSYVVKWIKIHYTILY